MAVSDYSTTAGSNTSIGGIGIEGTSPITNFDNALRQLMADIASGIVAGSFTANGYVSKAAGYTVATSDRGKIIDCTAALELDLPAAATAGAGFVFIVKANGGAVTVDPNSTENINGASTSLTVADGSFAIIACTGTAWHSISPPTPTSLSSPTITTPTLTLKQSATPTPTGEGDIQWDTDDHVIAVGDSAGTKLFAPLPASTAAGDLLYLSGAKAQSRLAKGTAGHVLTMNAGATAPEWAALPAAVTPDYGAGNAALAYGAVGTYGFFIPPGSGSTTYNPGDTIAGSSLDPAGVIVNGDGVEINTTSPSGTWRCMGLAVATNVSTARAASLFMRTV